MNLSDLTISTCKCGGRIALATADFFEVTYDQEPFAAGKEEPPGGETFTLGEGIELVMRICVDCQTIQDATVEIEGANDG